MDRHYIGQYLHRELAHVIALRKLSCLQRKF
jgi:hypothetical protein